jgi:predicted ATP-binding protein involved in virulence
MIPVILKTTPMKDWCVFDGWSSLFVKACLVRYRSLFDSGESNCRKKLSKILEMGLRPYSVLCDNERAVLKNRGNNNDNIFEF